MDVFQFRDDLVKEYSDYIESFISIGDQRISKEVKGSFESGIFWPQPLIQMNPNYISGGSIEDLVKNKLLHPECQNIFKIQETGQSIKLHKHQTDAIALAQKNENYVVTTGTGSGKSLTYIIPIVDWILKNGPGNGIKAIIVYPMNALANSQMEELKKFIDQGKQKVTFKRYTGQEKTEEREDVFRNPPDILLTNYMMLELMLTRPDENQIIHAAQGLKFLVLDELHTYRGRQGADVSLLVRRTKQFLNASSLQCVGTSATMSSEGNYQDRQKKVAEVASLIFGVKLNSENIIGESLKKVTANKNIGTQEFVNELKERISSNREFSKKYDEFINDPVAIWLENTFGITNEKDTNRLVRSVPLSIDGSEGAAEKLNKLVNIGVKECADIIRKGLLAGFYCDKNPETGFRPFAFKLHQFISRGENVYASLESEDNRFITLSGQQFVPGDRSKVLLPVAFCRECGQEYYSVFRITDSESGAERFIPRDLFEKTSDDDESAAPGFLYASLKDPWPTDMEKVFEKIPEDWIEIRSDETRNIKKEKKNYIPHNLFVSTDGTISADGLKVAFIQKPFSFCLKCGVSYNARTRSDITKLATLDIGGRSTATTILALSTIRRLRNDQELEKKAKKLLSFTDNRQDASLQAGHFNDFVETGLLRAALYKAVKESGVNGLRHEELTAKVFDALSLPKELYAINPNLRFQALEDTNKALREVIGYRVYRDLERGWRITTPNLEQCGLLSIEYPYLKEIASANDLWSGKHPVLASASNEVRESVCKTLLDYMRRELLIKVDYLDKGYMERVLQLSSQNLLAPWAIDENEKLEFSGILFPRSRTREDYGANTYMSPRSGYGSYLRRAKTFPENNENLKSADISEIISNILESLVEGGLLDKIKPEGKGDVPGYQLRATAMCWKAGTGQKVFHDPIRVPNIPENGAKPNKFFVEYYSSKAIQNLKINAKEHTAQVPSEEREKREEQFRAADLPVLFCSPTMELGIDISALNVVNMRNIPPTPANYAQRSGRAGRSGQPALVFSYSVTGSSHDQYFFRRPTEMVAGSVTAPCIDLANEDLLRSHIYAIWLKEVGLNLKKSLKDIIDLNGENPTLDFQESIKASFADRNAINRTRERAKKLLSELGVNLANARWYTDRWLDDILTQIEERFRQSCERWKSLYKAAHAQLQLQHRIISDASKPPQERDRANRLYKEAKTQLDLLRDEAAVTVPHL